MKITLFTKILLVTCLALSSQLLFAQLPDGFDIKKAYKDAHDKGISATDIEGYVQYLHNDYLSHKNGVTHSHNQQNTNKNAVNDFGTIYLGGSNPSVYRGGNPNTPQNIYCPNAGFEQLTFANWTGGYGTVATGATGAGQPIYNQTSATIVNTAGNNVGLTNTINYHTIMTTPATNSVYPNCVGWDSIACKVVGTQTVSEIPVVNPFGGPASVRLNGANANYRASKVNYNMTLNPNNKSFSVSYALVLYSGGHNPNEQPYFSVKVTDQNGNPVPGCSVYTVTINSQMTNTASPLYDPSWTASAIGWQPSDVFYRKWSTYAFDFSNYPAVTSVNVEFYVGGCSQGGHWGYAYVDAECSQGGAVASFCAGSNTSVLTAPAGYNTYQWVGPSGPVSVANGGNTGTATISPVTAGQVFTCNVTAPNGCLSSFQTTVSITTISITGVSSTPSCPNGGSGTANVNATGSSLGYSYAWVNSSNTPVGNTQTATGLSPGVYSVTVSSPLCGSQTTTVSVGISPPLFYGLAAPYCGSVAWITKPGGSNYKWYTASPLALIGGATTSSLTINAPVNGAQYFLVYTTASGCKDSIKYTLTQSPGGSIYVSNIKTICPGNNNSYAVVNLQTAAPPVYNYTVTGPAGYSSILTNTTAVKDSVVGLSIGTYSVVVFDGQCLYNTTFTVNPFAYTYTLTPQTSTICTSGNTTLTVNFGNTTPAACGLSSSGGCSSPALVTVGTGAGVNLSNSWPSIYGNWYRNARHQLLYTAAELLAAGIQPGKLSSIAFNIQSIPSTYIGTIPGVVISLKCTSASALTSTFDNTGLVQVYNAANFTPVVGWNTHNFTTAYEWDGTTNVLVDVCYSLNSANPYTTNPFNFVSTTPAIQCIYAYSDSQPMCLTTSFASTSTTRPNVRFQNCGGSNPALFTYTWTPSAGLSSTTSYTTIANPSATTVYSVQVNPIGQTNCMQAQTATISVINPVPATITPVSTMCTNASTVALTVTPTGGSWTGAGISATGVLTPSLAVVGNNTYTYSAGSGTCASTGTTTIAVEQYVPSTITGSIAPLCITNNTVNLAAAPLSTSTLGVGVWAGNGVTGTVFSPSVAGVGTHSLTYSTHSVPTLTLCPSTSTLAVSVSSVATPVITSAGPYCDSFTAQTMTATPAGGVWTSTNAATAISAAGILTPNSTNLGANNLIYTLTNGPCTASATTVVNIEHFIPATIIGAMGPYCVYDAGGNLQPTAQFTGGVWSGPGVTGSNFSPALATPGLHTITYSTTSLPTTTLCPDSKTLNIQVNDKPNANLLANLYQDCNPLKVDFSTSTVNTGQVIWNFGDGSPQDTGFIATHTYTVPGTYSASLIYTDPIGCKDSTNAPNTFTVFANPVASFAPSLLETTVVDGQIDFTNNSTVLNNNTYSWDIGGLATSTQTNTSYLFTNAGNYLVTLTATSPDNAPNNCVDDTTIIIVIKPDVVLYVPNAFTPGNGDGLNDMFQIFLPPTGVDYSTFKLSVYDRWGEVIYKTTDVTQFWNGRKNNTGPILKQEVYVWKIEFQDELKKPYEKMGHVSLLAK